MYISLELPDTPKLLNLAPGYFEQAMAAMLYHVGSISEKEACGMMKISRRMLEDLLPKFGIAVMSDSPQQIEIERRA